MIRSLFLSCAMLLAVSPAIAQAPSAPSEPSAATPMPHRYTVAELRQRYQKPGDRYLDVKGVELRYRDEGKGPVLLLLHGSRSTLNQWDGFTARLKGRYRIIRYDQPPTGLSGPLSDEARAAIGSPEGLVLGVLDKLGVAKATIVGVSSGGTAAYYFAGTHPDRVNAIVLSNTPSDPVPNLKVKNPADLDAAVANFKRNGYEGMDFWNAYLKFLYGEPGRITPGLQDYYYNIALRQKEPNQLGLHALTANAETTMARLKAVKTSTLILWGMRDEVLKPANGMALFNYLTNAKSRSFVALEDVGHYPPMEIPERFADLVDAYLRLAI